MNKLSLLLLAAALSSCAHSIHQVHTSDFIPAGTIESGEMVKGYAEQFVILGFVSETDYVDQAFRNIQAACPGGAVTGITTQISTSLGFLSWTNKALLQGLCLRRTAAAQPESAPPSEAPAKAKRTRKKRS